MKRWSYIICGFWILLSINAYLFSINSDERANQSKINLSKPTTESTKAMNSGVDLNKFFEESGFWDRDIKTPNRGFTAQIYHYYSDMYLYSIDALGSFNEQYDADTNWSRTKRNNPKITNMSSLRRGILFLIINGLIISIIILIERLTNKLCQP